MTDTRDTGRDAVDRHALHSPEPQHILEAQFAATLFLREQIVKYLELQRSIIAAGHRLDDVMRLTVDKVSELMPGAGGAVVDLLDGDMLECRASKGDTVPPLGFRVPLEGSFSGVCLEIGHAMLCVDTMTDVRVHREACDIVGVRSMVVAPLFVHGKPRGALKILSDKPSAFGVDELLVAELLAGPIIIGLSARAAREQAAEKLALEQRYRATFEHAAVGVIHVSKDGDFTMANRKFCELVGREPDALLGTNFRDITHPDDLPHCVEMFHALVNGAIESFTVEKRYMHVDGAPKWSRLTTSAVHDPEGGLDYFVSIIEDIGPQKQAQQEVLLHPLTGLPNRRWLSQNLPHVLARNGDKATALGLTFIDLDGFKSVNDRFGHDIGDRCLIAVAEVIRARIGVQGAVVHFAGDEFILIFEGTDQEMLAENGLRVRKAIRRLALDNDWPIDASIGSLLIPGGRAAEPGHVLKLADDLMYSAKRSGGGRQAVASLDDAMALARAR